MNRNNGRLVATCTSETVIGSALRLVMNQPEAVSNIAMPTFEIMLADQMTAKAAWPNAPQPASAAVRIGE